MKKVYILWADGSDWYKDKETLIKVYKDEKECLIAESYLNEWYCNEQSVSREDSRKMLEMICTKFDLNINRVLEGEDGFYITEETVY